MKGKKDQFSALALRLLQKVCPAHLFEEIEGDLIQRYNRDVKEVGVASANRRLWWNTIRFIRPGIIFRKSSGLQAYDTNLMLHNHAITVFRQAKKSKVFSIVNLLGLTTGIFVSLLIANFVWWEWNFDRHIKNVDRTYRINLYNTSNGVFKSISPETVSGLAYVIKLHVSGIELIARLGSKVSGIVATKERKFENREDKIVFGDAAVIDALALDILHGDKSTALQSPQSLIISESAALKYFGSSQVTGETLEIGFSGAHIETKSYTITAVFADIPLNSHQNFDFLLLPDNQVDWNKNWAWSNVVTYAILSPGVTPQDLEAPLAEIVRHNHLDGQGDRYILERVADVRLHALNGTGRAWIVNFFLLLGIVILSLAWLNYINLSTARFLDRLKEVGIRKLIGASRLQLIFQFLTEAFLFNTLAYSLAVILFFLIHPFTEQILRESIPITFLDKPEALLFGLVFIGIGTLCTGFYPAIFLSSFRPLGSLKGNITTLVGKSGIRNLITVVQLSVSIILVTAVLAIERQINFMREQNLGVSIEQTVIIDAPLLTDSKSVDQYETLKHSISKLPAVRGVTYASSFPGAEIDWHRTDITLGEENAGFRYDSRIISIGTEFLDLFDLPLLAGRNFDPRIQSDSKAMLINEEAVKMFGFASNVESINQIIFVGSRRFEVIGVVKNHHYKSLQSHLQPILYIQGYPRNPAYAIKLSTEDFAETINAIESQWKLAYAGNVFKYYFLDDFFDQQYTSERRASRIVSGLTIVGIFISCCGLFGLSLHVVDKRVKEIGIRKVLGATVMNVVTLLSRDFVKLMIIGTVIAVPVAVYCAGVWLDGYAYKTEIDIWLIVTPVALVLLLTLITISFKTVAAAKRNPVESMKYE